MSGTSSIESVEDDWDPRPGDVVKVDGDRDAYVKIILIDDDSDEVVVFECTQHGDRLAEADLVFDQRIWPRHDFDHMFQPRKRRPAWETQHLDDSLSDKSTVDDKQDGSVEDDEQFTEDDEHATEDEQPPFQVQSYTATKNKKPPKICIVVRKGLECKSGNWESNSAPVYTFEVDADCVNFDPQTKQLNLSHLLSHAEISRTVEKGRISPKSRDRRFGVGTPGRKTMKAVRQTIAFSQITSETTVEATVGSTPGSQPTLVLSFPSSIMEDREMAHGLSQVAGSSGEDTNWTESVNERERKRSKHRQRCASDVYDVVAEATCKKNAEGTIAGKILDLNRILATKQLPLITRAQAAVLAVEWSENASKAVTVLGKMSDVWHVVGGVPTTLLPGTAARLGELSKAQWSTVIPEYGLVSSPTNAGGKGSIGASIGQGIAIGMQSVLGSGTTQSQPEEQMKRPVWSSQFDTVKTEIRDYLRNNNFSLAEWNSFNSKVIGGINEALLDPKHMKHSCVFNTLAFIQTNVTITRKMRLLQDAILGRQSESIIKVNEDDDDGFAQGWMS